MLQVARLAPTLLGDSRDLVRAFLESRVNPDGGFQDRTGQSDLYYTVFGLEGLSALSIPAPPATVA
jgi:prenyltransferase beta subunit